MSFSSPTNDILYSLKHYTSHLEAKNEALAELSRTSTWLSSMLEQDGGASVEDVLEQRERQCERLMELCAGDNPESEALVSSARHLAESSKDELGQAARTLLALNSRYEALSKEIMTCQQKCETILKSRLEATSRALRQSVQRRKLDAAYGPACRHDTPTFMDKQS
jgi:predicted RNase H-like nuclease (RuvC/YqgF family)